MSKEQTLKDYIAFKKTSIKSEKKIKDVEREINRFLNSSNKKLEGFKEKEIIDYLNSLNFKKRSMNDIKVGIKNFIKWKYTNFLSDERTREKHKDWILNFPNLDKICKSEKITDDDKPYLPKQMLTKKEVEKLVNGETDLMWKNFWLMYFYGGFRPVTILALTWDMILFEKKGIIIEAYSPKNQKTYYKSLPKHVEEYLTNWKTKNDSKWLFPSPVNDGHLHFKSMAKRLANLSIRVLGKHVNPYMLRHSIGTILYNDDNLKDDDVANQMEHNKSMKATYLNLKPDQKKARARKMYLKAPKLSKEKQEELEKEVEIIKKQLKVTMNFLNISTSLINERTKELTSTKHTPK